MCRIPLRPILFLLREAIDWSNSSSACLSPDSTPVTSICSHSIGTLSALKIVLTASATSAPIPSPIQFCQIPLSLITIKLHTWNEGNCVFSTILGWLEDIGLYGCVCCSKSARIQKYRLGDIHLGRVGAYDCVETLVAARSKDCALLAIDTTTLRLADLPARYVLDERTTCFVRM